MSRQMMLRVSPGQCTGCRLCELSCSFHHYGVFRPSVSRVRVLLRGKEGFSFPEVCQKCDEAWCMAICEPGAITRDEVTGVMHVDHEVCTGCRRCVSACRYGGMQFDPTAKRALVCDFCDGDPSCVKNCWPGALEVASASVESQTRAELQAEALQRHAEYTQVAPT